MAENVAFLSLLCVILHIFGCDANMETFLWLRAATQLIRAILGDVDIYMDGALVARE